MVRHLKDFLRDTSARIREEFERNRYQLPVPLFFVCVDTEPVTVPAGIRTTGGICAICLYKTIKSESRC